MQDALANVLTPLPASDDQDSIKFQPVLHYDPDVCHFTAAIDENYTTNFGQSPASNNYTECQQPDRLHHANAYVRKRCNSGWCAYLYAYYAEMDCDRKVDHCQRHD